ncbi:MAG: peptidoglycan-binding domain-containing protein [Candidatus Sulfotelmatobacter sp.]
MQKRGAGLRSWMGTGCAVALICACASPRAALAHAADAAGSANSKASGDPVKPEAKSNTAATTHKSTAKRSSSHRRSKRKATARGQQKIDPQRAQEIQEALIREHYLSGEAAGTWNQASEDAMRRYQADHGWQSKTVPDARALISLGLGPSHDHLLNPESAMTTEPVTHASSLTPVSHSADPGVRPTATPTTPPAPATTPDHDGSSPQ